MGGACGGGHKRTCHRGHGKHGCHGKKGGKHGGFGTSSESEDSDSGLKARKQVPKEFRKYARVTVNQLHKNKGNNSDNKEKATGAGIPAEVQEFVEQILMEFHAKMSSKRPRAIAMEMMAGERTLPAGMEQGHFLWLCRFLARWHRRHAGKCEAMSSWSSGETSDDTSGEEEVQEHGPGPYNRRELRAAMRMARHPPFFMHPGGMGYGGMGYPCHGPPAFRWGPQCGARRGCWMGGRGRPWGWGGQRWRGQCGGGAGGAAPNHCSVNHMTERLRRM